MIMKKKKQEKEDVVAVIEFVYADNRYIVPIDNWNKAIEEGRTEPVILGDELHFFTKEDYDKIKAHTENKKYEV